MSTKCAINNLNYSASSSRSLNVSLLAKKCEDNTDNLVVHVNEYAANNTSKTDLNTEEEVSILATTVVVASAANLNSTAAYYDYIAPESLATPSCDRNRINSCPSTSLFHLTQASAPSSVVFKKKHDLGACGEIKIVYERNSATAQVLEKKLTKKPTTVTSHNGATIPGKFHLYKNTYQESFSIEPDDPRRDGIFFLPNVPVYVQIVGHEEEPSLVLLHTNFYIININHGSYRWTIKRRYKNFLKLYEAFTLFKTKLNLKNVAAQAHLTAAGGQAVASSMFMPQAENETNENGASSTATVSENDVNNNNLNCTVTHSSFKPSDHFKLLFQSIASDFNQAKNILEKFLKDVVDHKLFRNHNETLKFLEVSHMSFISDLGEKNKEGLIKKPTFKLDCLCFFSYNFFWDSRWLLLKDSWLGCLDHKTGLLTQVLLVDQAFRVLNGAESTGVRNGLLIENSSRSLLVKCYNEKRAHEWRLAILQMTFSTGEKFFNAQRYGSFAPVRENSLCKWFVDGQDYMESVADSIELAREEIFITGFFLTPEIYLKRPILVGDRWRLDKLLQRKASEGVKIYILLYKEIEMTLSINSAYAKRILALSHKNIKVLRHPDHINEPNKLYAIMWAHHEKLVVIDQSVAYFGGVDLCYGRWDNHLHKLTDLGSVLPSNSTHNRSNSTVTSSNNQTSNQHQHIHHHQLQHVKQSAHATSLETISSLPNEDCRKSSGRAKINAIQNPVRLISYRMKSIDSPLTDEINSCQNLSTYKSMGKTATTVVVSKPDAIAPQRPTPKQLRTVRMLSSPSCSIDTIEESGKDSSKIESDTDERDDYEENFKNEKNNDPDAESFYKTNYAIYNNSYNKTVISDGNNNRAATLKRSKSLDMSNVSQRVSGDAIRKNLNNGAGFGASPLMLPDSINNRLKSIKETIIKNYRQRTTNNSSMTNNNHATSTPQGFRLIREYGEMSILSKLKKIKQFKDNLKKYKLRLQHDGDTTSELNSSVEIERELDSSKSNDHTQLEDKCFGPSESEQLLSLLQGSSKYWVGKDYCNFIYRDVKDVHVPFKDSIDRKIVPRMPWHDVAGCVSGAAARDIARHFIQRWNYIKTKKVSKNAGYTLLVPKAYRNFSVPRDLITKASSTCHVQVLRSVSNWSTGVARTEASIQEAMLQLITTSKHYVYIENQFFVSMCHDNDSNVQNSIAQRLYERIVKAHRDKEAFKVYIVLPLIPGYEGEYGKSSGVLLHAITHYNNHSLTSMFKKLSEASIDALNYICVFSLRTWAELNGRLVTELIYVHSKLMIVDDRACIIGSANINDRSLLGNRDSELSLLVEDTQFVSGMMNKKSCQVGRFASSLRQRLFKEFLGEFPHNNCCGNLGSACASGNNSSFCSSTTYNNSHSLLASVQTPRRHINQPNTEPINVQQSTSVDISDPCSDEFYKQVLLRYAAQNTRIYDVVFKVIPCDYVSNFQQLKEYQKQSCLSQVNPVDARNELAKVKGYIVLYPNRFLCFEDLTPPLGTKEKLLPSVLFT